MQWTCERCGLERDDKRGSGCNGVKGQAHEWVETQVYKKQKRMKELQEWINSKESLEWKKKYEDIKKYFKESVINIQNNYLKSLEECNERYSKSLEEGKKKYNTLVEYSKKYFEFQELKIKEAKTKEEEIKKELAKKEIRRSVKIILLFILLMAIVFIIIRIITNNTFLAIISVIIIFILAIKLAKKIPYKMATSTFDPNEYVQQALKVFGDNYFNNDEERKQIFEFMNGEELEEAWITYKDNVEEEKISNLKIIEKEYLDGIRNILQKGLEIMQENNAKYKVDEEYSYDEYDFDLKHLNNLGFNDNFVFRYSTINDFRKKFIGDSDFIKKYSISEYLYC